MNKFNIVDANGIVQEFVLLDGEKKGDVVVTTRLKENVDEVINDAKAQRNAGRQTLGKGTQTSMYKIGHLSNLQAYELMRKGIFFDDKKLKQWIADRDNRAWSVIDNYRKGKTNAIQGI